MGELQLSRAGTDRNDQHFQADEPPSPFHQELSTRQTEPGQNITVPERTVESGGAAQQSNNSWRLLWAPLPDSPEARRRLFQAWAHHGEGGRAEADADNFPLWNRENYERALASYRQALSIEEEVLGRNHPDVARTLITMARAHSRLEQPQEAERLLERALAIQEGVVGREDRSLVPVLEQLATTRLARSQTTHYRDDEGNWQVREGDRQHLGRAAAVFRRILSLTQPGNERDYEARSNALTGLSGIAESQNQPGEQEGLLNQLTTESRALRAGRHPGLISALDRLANFHGKNNPAAALPHVRESLRLRETLYGATSDQTAQGLLQLGSTLMAAAARETDRDRQAGWRQEQQESLQRARRIWVGLYGSDDGRVYLIDTLLNPQTRERQ